MLELNRYIPLQTLVCSRFVQKMDNPFSSISHRSGQCALAALKFLGVRSKNMGYWAFCFAAGYLVGGCLRLVAAKLERYLDKMKINAGIVDPVPPSNAYFCMMLDVHRTMNFIQLARIIYYPINPVLVIPVFAVSSMWGSYYVRENQFLALKQESIRLKLQNLFLPGNACS